MPQKVDDGLRPGDIAAKRAAKGLAQRAGQHIDLHSGMGGRPAPLRPHEPGRVAIVHHRQGAVLLGQRHDFGQFRQIAIHRKDAIRRDHDEPRTISARLPQLRLEIVHVGVCVTVTLCLAKPDAVDDRGMVEGVGDHRVLWPQKRLEQAAIGIEAGGEEYGICLAEEPRDTLLQLSVQVLRAADEPDRGHAVTMIVHRRLSRRDQRRVIRQPKVIVGAQVQHVAPRDPDMRPLRRLDLPFAFHQPLGVDAAQGFGQVIEETGLVRHVRISSVMME